MDVEKALKEEKERLEHAQHLNRKQVTRHKQPEEIVQHGRERLKVNHVLLKRCSVGPRRQAIIRTDQTNQSSSFSNEG